MWFLIKNKSNKEVLYKYAISIEITPQYLEIVKTKGLPESLLSSFAQIERVPFILYFPQLICIILVKYRFEIFHRKNPRSSHQLYYTYHKSLFLGR